MNISKRIISSKYKLASAYFLIKLLGIKKIPMIQEVSRTESKVFSQVGLFEYSIQCILLMAESGSTIPLRKENPISVKIVNCTKFCHIQIDHTKHTFRSNRLMYIFF